MSFIKNMLLSIIIMVFRLYPRFVLYDTNNINAYTEFFIKTNFFNKYVYLLNNILDYSQMKIISSTLTNIARNMDKHIRKFNNGYFRIIISRNNLIQYTYMSKITYYDVYKANKKTNDNTLIFFIKINSKNYKTFIEWMRKFSIYTWRDEYDYNSLCMKDFGINFNEDSIYISSNKSSMRLSIKEFINVFKSSINNTNESLYALFSNHNKEYSFSPIYNSNDIQNFIKATSKCIIFNKDMIRDNIQSLYNILSYNNQIEFSI